MTAEELDRNPTFKRILEVANKAYADDYLIQVWQHKLEGHESSYGDGLAEFLVSELMETFDPGATESEQWDEAVRVILQAKTDVLYVYEALYLEAITQKANARRAAETASE